MCVILLVKIVFYLFPQDTGKIKLKDKAITPVITPLDDCAVHIEKDVKAIFTGKS